MISFHKVSFSYKNITLFENIDLIIKSNFVFLLGENGSGKTTLLDLIAKIKSHKGKILFKNQKIKKDNIFYMESERSFLPKIKGSEYLKYRGTLLGIELSNDDIEKLSKEFSLPLNLYIEKYSTGMKKKLEFLPSLFKKYDLYLFDEPFLGLDYSSSYIVKKTIDNLINKDSLIIISTHDLEYVKDNTDRMILNIENRTLNKLENYINYEERFMQNITNKIDEINKQIKWKI